MGVAEGPPDLVGASGHGDVVAEVGASVAEHLLNPVVAGHAAVELHVVVDAEVGYIILVVPASDHRELVLVAHEVVGAVHLNRVGVGHLLHSPVDIVAHGDLAARAALGGHEHYAVSASGTVDRGREGVLEHVDRLDVGGGDVGDAFNREAVHYIEGGTVLGDGAGAAHADLDLGVGFTFGGGHLHAGHASGERFAHGSHRHGGQSLAVDRRHGSEQILTLHGGIADHDGLVEKVRILLEDDVDYGGITYLHMLGPESDAGEDEGLSLCVGDGQSVAAVSIRGNSESGAFHENGDSRKSRAVLVIDRTPEVLRVHRRGGEKPDHQKTNLASQIIHRKLFWLIVYWCQSVVFQFPNLALYGFARM